MAKINPEQLIAGSADMQGLVTNYEKALTVVVQEGDLALSGLTSWTEAYYDSGQALNRFLQDRDQNLRQVLADITATTSGIVNMVPEVLHGLDDFSKSDRMAYQEALRALSLYSVENSLRRSVSDRAVQLAIRSALDKRVLREAEVALSLYSAKNTIRTHASGESAAAAMYRGLDKKVYAEARSSLGLYSAKNTIRTHASSKAAEAAMDAGLDYRVIGDAVGQMGIYSARNILSSQGSPNVDDRIAKEVLIKAFPSEMMNDALEVARKKFIQDHQVPLFIDLENPPTTTRINALRGALALLEQDLGAAGRLSFIKKRKLQNDVKVMRSYLGIMQDGLAWLEKNPSVLREWEDIEVRIRTTAGGQTRGGRRQRTYVPPRAAEAPGAKKVSEKERIYEQAVNHLALKDRSLGSTISSYPKHAVLRVINTVILARQKAAEKGEQLSDRDILIRYMRISNNNPDATPEQIQSTQIMLTLMGNSVTGKLPF